MKWPRGVVAGLVVAVAACGEPSSSTDSSVVDGPVIRYAEATSGGDSSDAEVRGRLELDGDCLYVALDEVGERYPIVWPAGTAWDAEEQAVVSPSTARMPVGSEVYGGGGYFFVEDVKRLLGAEAEALAGRCVDNTDGEIAFVNNGDDAIGPAR